MSKGRDESMFMLIKLKAKLFKCFLFLKKLKMGITQGRSERKVSGGRYRDYRKKRAYEITRESRQTKIGKRKIKKIRIRAGKTKRVLLSCDVANVFDGKNYCKVKINSVIENPANRHFVIRNIISKGAIIDTEIGKAKVTSRPGQEGSINAVLIEKLQKK